MSLAASKISGYCGVCREGGIIYFLGGGGGLCASCGMELKVEMDSSRVNPSSRPYSDWVTVFDDFMKMSIEAGKIVVEFPDAKEDQNR